MITEHNFVIDDSREIDNVEENEADLVITSPPYPMIQMWDEMFSQMNSKIEERLESQNPFEAFELMHKELDKVWSEVDRITKDEAIICVNIGDATRTFEDFHLFHNHSRIIESFTSMGYSVLPSIIWRKPTNKASKFMGSGMIPPNAYVTLEHEYILIFRKDGTRNISGDQKRALRYDSSYFWEERNEWFSDVWSDITGVKQEISNRSRDRTAAYPIEVPYRIINMYSIQGDTVFDPFLGTGTTSVASAMSGRNSIGVEFEKDFIQIAKQRMNNVKTITKKKNKSRINNHIQFINKSDKTMNYQSEQYGFGVVTKQEKQIKLPQVKKITKNDTLKYTIEHEPYEHRNTKK